jgi:hypothetical protein
MMTASFRACVPILAGLGLLNLLMLLMAGCGQVGRGEGDDVGGGGIVLAEQVRVIDDVDEAVVEADLLRFPRETHAELASLAAGVVVIGDRQGETSQRRGNPDGFLRRVVTTELVGEDVVLHTELASLMDVVDEGQLATVIDVPGGTPVGLVEPADGTLRAHHTGLVLGSDPDLVRRSYSPLPIADRVRITALAPLEFSGLKLGPVDKKLEREFMVKGVPVKAEMFVKAQLDVAEGSLSLEPDFGLSADYSLWSGLKGFEFYLAGALETRLTTHFKFATGIDIGVDFEKAYGEATAEEKQAMNDELAAFAKGGPLPAMTAKIAEAHIDLPTWWLPTPIPIPVVSTAVFELGLVCDASVRGTAEATFRQDASASLKIGGHYVKGDGWAAIDERTWSFEPSTEVVGAIEAEAQCELLPKFTLLFYGLGGPEMAVGGAARGSLTASQTCPGMQGRPKVDVAATLAASVSATVAAKFGLFIPRLDVEYTLAEAMLEVFRLNYDLGEYPLWSGYPDYGFAVCPEEATPCDGDGTCDADETCMACAADCGACQACGDDVCVQGENCESCPADCGACDQCGDGQCDVGEDCGVCPADCSCTECGDAACGWDENCAQCPEDCGACQAGCGDFVCDPDEDCQSCEEDCGACGAVCGDQVCEAGEDCLGCPEDCGACEATCNNGACEFGESCADCPEDCGTCEVCGDDVCAQSEWCDTCPTDCGGCTCGCVGDPQFVNYCQFVPDTEGCPMTAPGGYCDPNGDGDYGDADWAKGEADYAWQCL